MCNLTAFFALGAAHCESLITAPGHITYVLHIYYVNKINNYIRIQ